MPVQYQPVQSGSAALEVSMRPPLHGSGRGGGRKGRAMPAGVDPMDPVSTRQSSGMSSAQCGHLRLCMGPHLVLGSTLCSGEVFCRCVRQCSQQCPFGCSPHIQMRQRVAGAQVLLEHSPEQLTPQRQARYFSKGHILRLARCCGQMQQLLVMSLALGRHLVELCPFSKVKSTQCTKPKPF